MLPYVVSLSSIPPRFAALRPGLDALLAQAVRPEAVLLQIPRRYRRFPDWDGTLPDVPRGVAIRRPEEDLGPATKALFAAEELASDGTRLLYCDDDRLYMPDWSRRLLAAATARPGHAVVSAGYDVERVGLPTPADRAMPRARKLTRSRDWRYHLARLRQNIAYGGRARVPYEVKGPRNHTGRSGHVDIAEGFGGVLVEPRHLTREAWDIPPVMWAVDDVWLSGHLARAGVPIWAEAFASRFTTSRITGVAALGHAVIDEADRGQANLACATYMRDTYGVWRP